MPRHDGVPVEFYLQVWDIVGPLLLEVLCANLSSGRLHPQLTHGVLVLLAKKGNQLLIGNKRGLTLLNSALKILTKLYQLCLSPILQRFVFEQ